MRRARLELFSRVDAIERNRWPANHLVKCKAALTNASNAALMFFRNGFSAGAYQRHGMMPITKRGS